MTQIAAETGMQDRAGIGPGPYTSEEPEWPTYGYDGTLVDWFRINKSRRSGGRTREEWLAIADEMLSRWTEWREWCRTAPDVYFEVVE